MPPEEKARTFVDSVTDFFRVLRHGPRELALALLGFLLLGAPALIPAKEDFPSVVQDVRPWIVFALIGLGLAFLIAVVWIVSRKVLAPVPEDSDAKISDALKGASAFTPEDGELFARLGRTEEMGRLRGWVLDDQVTLVVVKGESGAGKTSLLRAGLTHALRADDVAVVYWEASPAEPESKLLQAIRAKWGSDAPLADFDQVFGELDGRRCVVVLDQLEQLSPQSHPGVFEFLTQAAAAGRPCPVTCIVAFREEYASTWMDIEADMARRPELLSLKLFSLTGAERVVSVLVEESGLAIQRSVVSEILEGVAEKGRVSPVDIGIGLLALSELATEKAASLTLNEFRVAGGQVGLLGAYLERVLDRFPTVRQDVFKALLQLRDPEQLNRRLAAGLSRQELAGLVRPTHLRHFDQALSYLALRRARVLEEVREDGADADGAQLRFRLTHERLIPALERLNGVLLAEAEQARMLLERRYRSWSGEKDDRFLLSGRELRLALLHRGDFHWGEDASGKKEFLQLAKGRRSRRVGLAVSAIVLIAVLAAFGWDQYKISIEAERIAERLDGWGLPRDIGDYLRQLEEFGLIELKVPVELSLDEYQWLRPARNLQRLDLRHSSVAAVKGLPGSLTSLDLSYTVIPSLEGLPGSLTSLVLSSTGITSLEGLPGSLTSLDLGQNRQIPSLEGLPGSLTSLDLSETGITSLEGLPGSLTSLDLSLNRFTSLVRGTGITSLEGLPDSLTSLDLSGTGITSLEGLPASLTSLDLSGTGIGSLEGLPASLTSLDLSGTGISSLEGLPASLTSLNLSGSGLTSLEGLPASLTSLKLHSTGISSLEGLPDSLTSLNLISNPQITNLEGLPDSLASLDLTLTVIPSLEGLPASLTTLYLSDTEITSLEGLPASLTSLVLRATGIISLEGLPDSLTSLVLRGTGITSLEGLPPNLEELTLQQRQVSSLQGLPKTVRRLVFYAKR